jgi:cytochrome oxidase Cu insertion factor (SCO1/SenC/PrrC family)
MKFSISPRTALLVITAMFLLPLILAWLMYSGSVDYRPGSTRNLGTLIEPTLHIDWRRTIAMNSTQPADTPIGMAPDSLLEHWVVLHPVPAGCDAVCQKKVAALRQIHLATGRHQSRLRVALLLDESHSEETAQLLKSMYRKFTLIGDPEGILRRALAAVRPGDQGPIVTGNGTPEDAMATDGIYLIDPLGNIMMYYTADADPNHIRQDLKRLLTWSKLDEQS